MKNSKEIIKNVLVFILFILIFAILAFANEVMATIAAIIESTNK